MEQKILNYSISLAFCLLLSLPLQAQNSNISNPTGKHSAQKGEKRGQRGSALSAVQWYFCQCRFMGTRKQTVQGDFFQ